jgi:hypothetical protein
MASFGSPRGQLTASVSHWLSDVLAEWQLAPHGGKRKSERQVPKMETHLGGDIPSPFPNPFIRRVSLGPATLERRRLYEV